MFSIAAREHRKWCQSEPQGSKGGWDAAKIQQLATVGFITQAQADEIIATEGKVGSFQTLGTGPVVA